MMKMKEEKEQNGNLHVYFLSLLTAKLCGGIFYNTCRIVKALSVSALSYFTVVITALFPYLKFRQPF